MLNFIERSGNNKKTRFLLRRRQQEIYICHVLLIEVD